MRELENRLMKHINLLVERYPWNLQKMTLLRHIL